MIRNLHKLIPFKNRKMFQNLTFVRVYVLLLFSTPLCLTGKFSEPSSVIYGKVFGVGSKWPFIMTEGQMEWSIRDNNGKNYAFKVELAPYSDGKFSYRLNLPLKFIADRNETDDGANVLGVSSTPAIHFHHKILVNGLDAKIMTPSLKTFNLDQLSRASTQRIDIEVEVEAPDLDGDGLPDHWEDQFGFNNQDSGDADLDTDSDGVSNIGEYITGTNPRRSDDEPTIMTEKVEAYEGVQSGVLLNVHDSDSSDEEIILTLLKSPTFGQLHLRSVSSENGIGNKISVGDKLSLKAFKHGRIIYFSDSMEGANDSMRISASDGDPEHEIDEKDIEIHNNKGNREELASSFRDRDEIIVSGLLSEDEGKFLLGLHHDFIVWDHSESRRSIQLSTTLENASELTSEEFLNLQTSEKSHLIIGGYEDDKVSGGIKSDVIIGGHGDDELTGGLGADSFVVSTDSDGNDTIIDFKADEGDSIDLRLVMQGYDGHPNDYLSFRNDQGDGILEIGPSLDQADNRIISVRLKGLELSPERIRQLIFSESIKIPNSLVLPPELSIETISNISENSGLPGLVRVYRDGPTELETEFFLSISGSATNSIDYQFISDKQRFLSGQSFVDILVAPFQDSITEPVEVAEFWIRTSQEYTVSSEKSSAILTIKDMLPELSLELIRGFEQDSELPALVLLKREKLMANSLFVRLNYSGNFENKTVINGPSFVSFVPGQSVELLEIFRSSELDQVTGNISTNVAIETDSTYLISDKGSIELNFTNGPNFSTWLVRNFPDYPEGTEKLALMSPGSSGIPLLQRYAFGLDPEKPESSKMPKIKIDGHGIISVYFHKNPDLPDVGYHLEATDNLQNWQKVEGFGSESISAFNGGYTYQSRQTIKDQKINFFRLKILLSK